MTDDQNRKEFGGKLNKDWEKALKSLPLKPSSLPERRGH